VTKMMKIIQTMIDQPLTQALDRHRLTTAYSTELSPSLQVSGGPCSDFCDINTADYSLLFLEEISISQSINQI